MVQFDKQYIAGIALLLALNITNYLETFCFERYE